MSKVETVHLEVPTFDLQWFRPAGSDENLILLAGGGGNTKSGVKNKLQFAKEITDQKTKKSSYKIIDHVSTDCDDSEMNLCSGVSVGNIDVYNMINIILEKKCRLYIVSSSNSIENNINSEEEVKRNDNKMIKVKETNLQLQQVAEYKADMSDDRDSTINCSAILSMLDSVITAGDDKVCRLWKIKLPYVKGKESYDGTSPFKVILKQEYIGHTAPVMALSTHPDESLFCSASKDGTCKVWIVKGGLCAFDIQCSSGFEGLGSLSTSLPAVECRGCSFLSDGESLVTMQSPRKGSTILVKWDIIEKDSNKEPTKEEITKLQHLHAVAVRMATVSKFPCTKLRKSDMGDFLAIGSSDGIVSVYDEHMQKIESFSCHDLPVTGLGFAPALSMEASDYSICVASCSADNKLNVILLGGNSILFSSLVAIFSLILLLLLTITSYFIFRL